MHAKNLPNEYQMHLGDLFDRAPKAVLAAVAVSALTVGGGYLDQARARVLEEWWALYEAHVVAQRPPFPRPRPEEIGEETHPRSGGES